MCTRRNVEIEDTGIGIPPEHQEKIFGRFDLEESGDNLHILSFIKARLEEGVVTEIPKSE